MSPRAYDRRRREAAREETRRRIVEATFRLHGRHGGLATTYAMIAREANVSIPTVYAHFPDTSGLFAACTSHVPPDAPALGPAIFEGKRDLASRIEALVAAVFRAHAFWAPWMRWGYAEAAVIPEVARLIEGTRALRAGLVREALGPAFDGAVPEKLVALAGVLLDFPAWQLLTSDPSLTPPGAEALVAQALTLLTSRQRRKKGKP